MLGLRVICPISPANQRIILQIDGFQMFFQNSFSQAFLKSFLQFLSVYLFFENRHYGGPKRQDTKSLITAQKFRYFGWSGCFTQSLGILGTPWGHPQGNSSISTSILHQPQRYTDLALWRVINFCKESLSVISLCLHSRIRHLLLMIVYQKLMR